MAVFNQELADKRLGERAIMKNGQQATIIAYRGAADIDIQFDDGTVVERRAYNEFKRRNIRNPQYNPPNPVAVKRIGETRTMSNGQKATIVQYRTSTDIEILFEDGCLREHVRYPHFQSGKINPVDNAVIQQSRVGEERMMNCGFKCRIIKYTKAHDITVQFDDGIVLYGKHYTDFCNGAIVHPGIYGKQMSETGKRGAVSADDRLGMQKVMANGQKATIVEYRRADDIDVQFEDGTRRNHVSFFQFQYAKIKHPSELPDAQAHARVGEKRTMKNGKSASILRYHQYCMLQVVQSRFLR